MCLQRNEPQPFKEPVQSEFTLLVLYQYMHIRTILACQKKHGFFNVGTRYTFVRWPVQVVKCSSITTFYCILAARKLERQQKCRRSRGQPMLRLYSPALARCARMRKELSTPGIQVGISFHSVQKMTNAPPCGAGNSRKCPTPRATEDVPDEFVVE